MKKDYLIVAALPQESNGYFEKLRYPICYTGVGKLNASISLFDELTSLNKTTFKLGTHKKIPYKAVINLGTVGSVCLKVGEVFQVESFIERDMRCEPLSPKYHVPFSEKTGPINTSYFYHGITPITCGTGDSFLNRAQLITYMWDYQAADMEGYALAKVCDRFRLPFMSLKYVSDSGDSKEWEKNCSLSSKSLYEAALKVLSFLE